MTSLSTAAAMFAFASNSLLCRAALADGHVDAWSFTLLRLTGGALVLGLLSRAQAGPVPSTDRSWGSAIALFAYALGFSLAYLRVTAGVGALLLFAAVQVTMVSAGWRAGERPRPREWIGLLVSVAGLVLLTLPGLSRPDPLGAVMMLGAGAGWGVYSLRGRRGGEPLMRNATHFLRAAPLAACATALGGLLGTLHIDLWGAGLALASGTLASALGYVVWFNALRGLSATRAATVQLSVPPLAAIGGVVILGEPFSAQLALATLLVVGGIGVAVVAPSR